MLIVVLYTIIDLSKYYLRQFQLENATKYAANMIQTISQKRQDKSITTEDLERIFHAAFLGIFVGESSHNKKYMTIKYLRSVEEEVEEGEEEIKKGMPVDKANIMFVNSKSNIPVGNEDVSFNGVSLSNNPLEINSSSVDSATNIYKYLPMKAKREKILLELGVLNSSPGLLGILFGSPQTPLKEDGIIPIKEEDDDTVPRYVSIGSVITFDPEDGLFMDQIAKAAADALRTAQDAIVALQYAIINGEINEIQNALIAVTPTDNTVPTPVDAITAALQNVLNLTQDDATKTALQKAIDAIQNAKQIAQQIIEEQEEAVRLEAEAEAAAAAEAGTGA
ncbi:hypothetical protein FACS189472_03420 [Alphaproteobacteria bacterium]|nr:hypothetical protein FACS189472_03420 [Alphaproteobacteria bacterium]